MRGPLDPSRLTVPKIGKDSRMSRSMLPGSRPTISESRFRRTENDVQPAATAIVGQVFVLNLQSAGRRASLDLSAAFVFEHILSWPKP